MEHSFAVRAASLSTALAVTFAPPVLAQDDVTPMPQPGNPAAVAEDPAGPRTAAPNTDHCPHSLVPPEPKTTSEIPVPGMASPEPLPVAVPGHCGVNAPLGFVVPDAVLASGWIVVDLDTGDIVASKDPHGRYRPASIIKVLLAMVAIRELDLNKKVTVSYDSASQTGSRVGIGENGEYTVEQLLFGLLLASGNDAAHALAQELGGDEATLQKINALAADLGAADTRAATYSGLDAPGMSSSAYDLALMYRAAFQDPTFTRIVSTEFVDFPGFGDLPGYQVWNDNGLFMNDPHGIGGKTGYTDDANHTFVGAMDRDGRRLLAVLLDDTIGSGRPWQQAQMLLNSAYALPPGSNVGNLEAALATEVTTPSVTPPPEQPSTAESSDSHSYAWGRSQTVGLVALIAIAFLALGILRIVFLQRSTRKRARHARRVRARSARGEESTHPQGRRAGR